MNSGYLEKCQKSVANHLLHCQKHVVGHVLVQPLAFLVGIDLGPLYKRPEI